MTSAAANTGEDYTRRALDPRRPITGRRGSMHKGMTALRSTDRQAAW
jgi:hypothetical protein